VAVSADGRRAVSASDDKRLKVWDVESVWPAVRGIAAIDFAGSHTAAVHLRALTQSPSI
jgi:hypothetical protein